MSPSNDRVGLREGRHTIDIIVDDDILVAVLDGDVSLSTRIYNQTHRRLGLFAREGAVTVHDVTVRTRTT